MTELTKLVKRVSKATRFEKSQNRRVVVTLEPNQKIGCRLEGTRQTYRLDIESVYELAVRHWIVALEKKAKRIQKDEGIPARSAKVKARKEMLKELK